MPCGLACYVCAIGQYATVDGSGSELTCAREKKVQVVQDAHDLVWLRHIYPTTSREPSSPAEVHLVFETKSTEGFLCICQAL